MEQVLPLGHIKQNQTRCLIYAKCAHLTVRGLKNIHLDSWLSTLAKRKTNMKPLSIFSAPGSEDTIEYDVHFYMLGN